MRRQQLQHSCIAFLLLAWVGLVDAQEVAQVASDVSFDSVIALPSSPPTAKLVYGEEQPQLQYGLLWLPDNVSEEAPAPLVIFIHGGCWLNEYTIEHSLPLTSALAAAGYAVWSLEYRRTGDPGGGWPGTFADILAGIKYITEASDYPIARDRFVLTGHSAGGHLALLAGTQTPTATAVIGLAAITDIAAYARGSNSCEAVTSAFMGAEPDAAPVSYRAANPAALTLHPNTLLMQGDRDVIVPLAQTLTSARDVYRQAGAGHFDWVHPGTVAFRHLLAVLQEQLPL